MYNLSLLDTDTTVWTNESYLVMIPNPNCLGDEINLSQCNFLIGTYIQECTYNAVKIKCLSGIKFTIWLPINLIQQNHVLLEMYVLLVLITMVEYRYVLEECGAQYVRICFGITRMPLWYVNNLDSLPMVSEHSPKCCFSFLIMIRCYSIKLYKMVRMNLWSCYWKWRQNS